MYLCTCKVEPFHKEGYDMGFRGTYTALITPFKENGTLDIESFERLCYGQCVAGNHLVPCGTTGESPTLSHEEHRLLIRTAIAVRKDFPNIQVVAGVGSNSTDEAIRLAEYALKAGADAGLSVDPPYNKPGQRGLYHHHKSIAEVGLPIIIYNIPGRSPPGLTPDTILSLAEHENIVALKAAAGVNDGLTKVLFNRPEGFSVLSGDDTLTHYMIPPGGDGTVSVASNAIPKEIHDTVQWLLDGSPLGLEMTRRYMPIMKGFMENGTNPEGIKEGVYHLREFLGVPDYVPVLRSPMMRLEEHQRRNVTATLDSLLNTTF
jgi:4-hydroxy-tetrahydrodipicolinate synthase